MKKGVKMGQNFLTSKKIAAQIAEAAGLLPKDTILEVGPGKGILTEKLLARAGKVIAVEKDVRLADFIEEKFSSEIKSGKLQIIRGDILKCDIKKILKANEVKSHKIVANIPYYITSYFLRRFLESDCHPQSMTLMVQKEVAERVTAKPPRMNLLALSVQAYGKPKKLFNVSRKYFSPAPKIDSAVISISDISRDFFKKHKIKERDFFILIKAGFAHKRKLLAGNLRHLGTDLETGSPNFEKCGVPPKARAQELSLEDWACLTDFCFAKKN